MNKKDSFVGRFSSRTNKNVQLANQNGEPWFIAKDVAKILGYATTEKMTKRLDEDEKDDAPLRGIDPKSLNKKYIVTIISESGLYNAVLGSKKPEAKPFKKRVTSDVLPTIRKTDGYGTSDPINMLRPSKSTSRGGRARLTLPQIWADHRSCLYGPLREPV